METATALALPKVIDLAPQRGINEGHLDSFIAAMDSLPKTKSVYYRAIKRFLSFIDTAQPTKDDFQAYKRHLVETVAPRTAGLYLTSARLFFTWLEENGHYSNISRGTKGVKVSKNHSKDNLTPDQVREVIAAAPNARDRAIIMLMITAGLRCIEIARANIEDIRNAGADTILYLQGKGKNSKDDYVKISHTTLKAIMAYLQTRKDANPTDPLFTSEANRNAGGRLTTISISRIVKNAMQAAGYNSNRLTAHSCRHTAATLSLLSGGTIQETQQLLRHANINTTMIYLHNMNRMQNNSEQRIDDLIFKED